MIFVYRCVCFLAFGLYLTSLAGCAGGEEGGGGGAMASVAWDPVNDPTVVSYTVHYGKHSSGGSGSCDYENSVDVAEPSADIRGLEFNAQYYFAVSSFNGSQSSCSDEISEKTPDGQSDVKPI